MAPARLRRVRRTLSLGLVFVVVLAACSPTIRVRAKVEMASGSALPPGGLSVRARALCHPASGVAPPSPPDAGRAEAGSLLSFSGDGGPVAPDPVITVVSGISTREGTIAFDLHGVECSVSITAWLDVTGDGEVGPGDYVGSIGPVRVVDRGLCAGNLNDVGPLRLEPVAP